MLALGLATTGCEGLLDLDRFQPFGGGGSGGGESCPELPGEPPSAEDAKLVVTAPFTMGITMGSVCSGANVDFNSRMVTAVIAADDGHCRFAGVDSTDLQNGFQLTWVQQAEDQELYLVSGSLAEVGPFELPMCADGLSNEMGARSAFAYKGVVEDGTTAEVDAGACVDAGVYFSSVDGGVPPPIMARPAMLDGKVLVGGHAPSVDLLPLSNQLPPGGPADGGIVTVLDLDMAPESAPLMEFTMNESEVFGLAGSDSFVYVVGSKAGAADQGCASATQGGTDNTGFLWRGDYDLDCKGMQSFVGGEGRVVAVGNAGSQRRLAVGGVAKEHVTIGGETLETNSTAQELAVWVTVRESKSNEGCSAPTEEVWSGLVQASGMDLEPLSIAVQSNGGVVVAGAVKLVGTPAGPLKVTVAGETLELTGVHGGVFVVGFEPSGTPTWSVVANEVKIDNLLAGSNIMTLGADDGVYLAMETEGTPGFLNLDEGACGDDDLGGGTHLMKLQPPGAPGENSSCQWVTSVIEH